MSGDKHKPGLMRSIGAFVGEIVKAVKSDPEKYDATSKQLTDDEVILRRTTTTTTVDEVRVRKDQPK